MATETGPLRAALRGSVATTAIVSVGNVLTSILLARHAGPAVLGQFVVMMAWAHAAFALLSPGFDQAYIRDPDAPGRWSTALWLTAVQIAAILVLPLIVLMAISTIRPAGAAGLSAGPLALLLVSIVLGVAGNLLLAVLAVRLDYRRINSVRLGAAIGSAGVSLALAWRQDHPDLTPFIARELATGTLNLLPALVLTAGTLPACVRISAQQLRGMLQFARDLWALNALEKLVQRAEYLVLAVVVPLSDVGTFYAVRSLFDGVHGMLMVPVQTVLFAFMSRGYGVGSVLSLLRPSWRLAQAVGAGIATALLMGLITPLFPMLLGPRYQTPAALPIAFTALIILLSYFELVKVTMMSQGRHLTLIAGRLLQLGVLAAAIPALAATGGMQAAAFAPVLAALVLCAVAWLVLRHITTET
jgi:O-antigen/teichoic acid export membrane protein